MKIRWRSHPKLQVERGFFGRAFCDERLGLVAILVQPTLGLRRAKARFCVFAAHLTVQQRTYRNALIVGELPGSIDETELETYQARLHANEKEALDPAQVWIERHLDDRPNRSLEAKQALT